MRTKIAILGSCISRDPFAFFPDDSFEITRFVARTSPISLMSPALDVDMTPIHDLNPFEIRCIYEDFSKASLSILNGEFDFLLLDFIEDRFDIAKIDDSYVLCTTNVLNSGILNQFPNHRIIPRAEPEVALLWAQSWLKLAEKARQLNIVNKLVLTCGVYCKHYKNEIGHSIPFDANHTRFAELNTHLINSYHAFARATLPNMALIEIEKELCLSVHDHKWGLQTFHYTDDYYKSFMRQLRVITGLDNDPTLENPGASK